MTTSVKGEDRLVEATEAVRGILFHRATQGRLDGHIDETATEIARQIAALPCKEGEADLLATLIEPSPGFFQVKAGHHAAFNIAVQRLRARHSAPSTKPDREGGGQ